MEELPKKSCLVLMLIYRMDDTNGTHTILSITAVMMLLKNRLSQKKY